MKLIECNKNSFYSCSKLGEGITPLYIYITYYDRMIRFMSTRGKFGVWKLLLKLRILFGYDQLWPLLLSNESTYLDQLVLHD